MDESIALSKWIDRTKTAACAESEPSGGKLQSFVELTELRRLLGRLMTTELLRMMVAETLT